MSFARPSELVVHLPCEYTKSFSRHKTGILRDETAKITGYRSITKNHNPIAIRLG